VLEYIAHVSLASFMLGSAPCWVSPRWTPWWAGTMGDEKTKTMPSCLLNLSVLAAPGSVATTSLRNLTKRKKDGSSLDLQEDEDL
jgi:hypothetical protein